MYVALSRRVQIGLIVLATFVGAAALTVISIGIVNRAREASHEARCRSQLVGLGFAMSNYHQTYGCFPPAYIVGPSGAPAHSWRVLLLPFLDRQDVYDAYDFTEAWDGPNNSRLANALGMNSPFCCPADPLSLGDGYTNYVVIRGPGTAFDADMSIRESDIADDPYETVLIVETTGAKIRWMEPRDLELDLMDYSVGKPTGNNISSLHLPRAAVRTAGGMVIGLTSATTERDIRAMTSIAGGERIDWNRFAPSWGN